MPKPPFVPRFERSWAEAALLSFLAGWSLLLFILYFQKPSALASVLARFFQAPPGVGPEADVRLSVFLGEVLRIIGASLIVLFTAFRSGSLLRQWMGYRPSNPLIGWTVDLSIGIMALDLLWFGLGSVNLWYAPWMEAALAALAGLLVLQFFARRPPFSLASIPAPGWPLGALGFAGSIYWLFGLFHSFLPETHNDGLVYHLGVPFYWLSRHGMADYPSLAHAHFPFAGELFLMNGLLLQGTESAKCLNTLVWAACALAAAGWAGESGGRKAGWFAFGSVLTLPLLELVAWSTQIEGFLTLYCLLFLYVLFRMIARGPGPGESSSLLLAGLMGGMALSIKYTALWIVGTGVFLFVFYRPDLFRRDGISRGAILPAALAGVCGIWWIKNAVYTGDPFFPYAAQWFGGRQMTAQGYEWMIQDQRLVPGAGEGWKMPWTLLMSGPSLFGFVGPLLLSLLPMPLFFRPRGPEWKWAAWTLFLSSLIGLATSQVLKFHAPEIVSFYVLFSVIAGAARSAAWIRSAAVIAVFSAGACFPYLAGMSRVYCSGWGVWTGREGRDRYLMRMVPDSCYPAFGSILGWLPPDSRLLIVGDSRSAYCPVPFMSDLGYEEPFLSRTFRGAMDLNDVRRKVREAGFTHILVNAAEGERINAKYPYYKMTGTQRHLLDEYFRLGLDLIHGQGGLFLFRVRGALRTPGRSSGPDQALAVGWVPR